MFVVRDVFTCKPGKAKDLVAKFKAAAPHLEGLGVERIRVLTDFVAGYWTVVLEGEIESLDGFAAAVAGRAKVPEIGSAMGGYMDLVTGGHREIFKIE